MSLVSLIGPRPNLLDLHSGGTHKRLEVRQPVLATSTWSASAGSKNHVDHIFRTATLPIVYPAARGAAGMDKALEASAVRPPKSCAAATTS